MKLICFILLLSLLFLGGCDAASAPVTPLPSAQASLAENVRAMWITQFDLTLLCLKDGRPRKREEYEARVHLMVSKLRLIDVNTVFIQARPNADALYPSSLFPPSSYAVGDTGEFSYDPFEILVDACRAGGLSPHAWINPLRAMRTDSPSAQNTSYPVGQWIADSKPYVTAVNGYYYLNPAYNEVRTLIADGAREILRTYDVDGLHIDDYFYPTTDKSFDAAAFSDYLDEGGMLSLSDFRRAQTQALIHTLSEITRAEGCLFGVSPGGNTERNRNELYADIEAFCDVGLLDYLCPQVYFGLKHETQPFEAVCLTFDTWATRNDLPLIVGLTLEKAASASAGGEDIYAGIARREWIEARDILAQCVKITQTLPSCQGVALFSYRLLFSPEDGTEYAPTAKECEALIPVLKDAVWKD